MTHFHFFTVCEAPMNAKGFELTEHGVTSRLGLARCLASAEVEAEPNEVRISM